MRSSIEKDWITFSGLRAVVIMGSRGTRCGYVGVPEGNRYFGLDYQVVNVEVHGGLTYSSSSTINSYPVKSTEPLWWFGYDCSHAWDRPSDEWLAQNPDMHYYHVSSDSTHRTLGYCMDECESLSKQLTPSLEDVLQDRCDILNRSILMYRNEIQRAMLYLQMGSQLDVKKATEVLISALEKD